MKSVLVLLLLASTSCSALRDLRHEISGQPWKKTLSFHFENNIPILDHASVAGSDGRFALAAGLPVTILDSAFAARIGLHNQLDVPVMFRQVESRSIRPETLDMGGIVDAMVGADALGPVLVVDYQRRIATIVRTLDWSDADQIHGWTAIPSLPVTIDGQQRIAMIDTTSPDTLSVPADLVGASPGTRIRVDLSIGDHELGSTDVLVTEGETIRMGNRVLQHFRLGIDYEGHQIALWRVSPD